LSKKAVKENVFLFSFVFFTTKIIQIFSKLSVKLLSNCVKHSCFIIFHPINITIHTLIEILQNFSKWKFGKIYPMNFI